MVVFISVCALYVMSQYVVAITEPKR